MSSLALVLKALGPEVSQILSDREMAREDEPRITAIILADFIIKHRILTPEMIDQLRAKPE